MIKLGYKLMSEEHGPLDLVRNAVAAEEAGFDFAAISDHFSPWLDEQGHAPLAWSVLGAVAQATGRIGLMTAVTCPTFRYHPAIVAQGAATVALLSGDRFTLGLGAGERLNEHVIGAGWPGRVERQDRLAEALDIIQGLLGGTLKNYQGRHLVLDHAELFDRPDRKVPVVLAAGGPMAARLAAEKADGLMATDADTALTGAYAKAGGKGPRYCEVSVCWGPSQDEAKRTAHKYFRWSAAGWPVMAELPDTEGFAAASASVTPDDIAKVVSCGPSIEAHVKAIGKYVDAGFDHVVITQIGPRQQEFCEVFRRELAPALKEKAAA
ncbi:TIGR03557 family F420-dependent LLM class oxidoreductase [Rhodoplanes sp. TEM]|uniref:TIGR03557 family F420-dependent LLM class oxidoreductase n=1 Tax=Rhodoplanes tepidamans TaxID=200616 RepID=A0ABT5JKF4_RHOTP|nr:MULTISPECIES: TIGR03557 family F420-dependent LLM class oxidoreductase [Rhodoplanes]MDC7790012.1 TIGR03557 family F420-dependent LLM class oxidoreductase [Rhodoplanes tepidamans]MDC7987954.1 TIGR03557 family F420-dependent LLM class oxidoreductase [Rhodoplanes sp. TEM]MDQ0358938.1 G6PDH family F420-dependent oxidoreductase [Rhodoplanes tepidamans]